LSWPRDGANLQEHRQGLGAVAELASSHLEPGETELFVEGDSIGLGVHHDAYAAEIIGHLVGEGEDGLEERGAYAPTPSLFVGREPSQSQDRQRISRQTLAPRLGQVVSNDLGGGHGREAQDGSVLDGDVGCSHVMTELILPGEELEEPIQLYVSRTKMRAIIRGLETPYRDRHQ
jgi:hypothetical protein